MNLHFHTKYSGGAPTHFKEKILDGRKKHSMVDDEADRWKEGNSIQMVVNPYSAERDHFNADRPDLQTCTGTQRFEIKWKGHDYLVRVDGHKLTPAEVEVLALNDGFDDLVSFLAWFKEDKKGKIIHWTKLRY